jgi:hypothetical protein
LNVLAAAAEFATYVVPADMPVDSARQNVAVVAVAKVAPVMVAGWVAPIGHRSNLGLVHDPANHVDIVVDHSASPELVRRHILFLVLALHIVYEPALVGLLLHCRSPPLPLGLAASRTHLQHLAMASRRHLQQNRQMHQASA